MLLHGCNSGVLAAHRSPPGKRQVARRLSLQIGPRGCRELRRNGELFWRHSHGCRLTRSRHDKSQRRRRRGSRLRSCSRRKRLQSCRRLRRRRSRKRCRCGRLRRRWRRRLRSTRPHSTRPHRCRRRSCRRRSRRRGVKRSRCRRHSTRRRGTRPHSRRRHSCRQCKRRRRRQRRSCGCGGMARATRRALLPWNDRSLQRHGIRLSRQLGSGSSSGLSSRGRQPRTRTAAACLATRRAACAAPAATPRIATVRGRQPLRASPRQRWQRHWLAVAWWALLGGRPRLGHLALQRCRQRFRAWLRLRLRRAAARGSARRPALLGGRASSARRSGCRNCSHLGRRRSASISSVALALGPRRRDSSRVRRRRQRHKVERRDFCYRPHQRRLRIRRGRVAGDSTSACDGGGQQIQLVFRRRRLARGRGAGRAAGSAARVGRSDGPPLLVVQLPLQHAVVLRAVGVLRSQHRLHEMVFNNHQRLVLEQAHANRQQRPLALRARQERERTPYNASPATSRRRCAVGAACTALRGPRRAQRARKAAPALTGRVGGREARSWRARTGGFTSSAALSALFSLAGSTTSPPTTRPFGRRTLTSWPGWW